MKKPTKKDCAGCRDDFYNYNRMGLNETESGPQCWSLAEATFEQAKDVPIDMRPPYTSIPLTRRPNCYRAKGYVRMKEAGR